MCGICGMALRNQDVSVDAELLQRMNDTIAHRGPDGDGVWTHGPVGLAQRRLAIIDLSEHGKQPMRTRDGNCHMTYNGEVYNFQSLRDEHFPGEEFASTGDTEVVLRLLARMGAAALPLFEGMYAFCFVDLKESKLVLARDPFGIKPLYYSLNQRHLVFGSEIKPIRASGLVSNEINPAALNDFFDFMWIPAPRSIYQDIQKLEPAHFLELDLKTWKSKIERYWRPQYHPVDGKSIQHWVEATAEEVNHSVKQQLIADVPVGTFLSGGIDSSLVTRSAALVNPETDAYTVDFDDKEFSELDYAKDIGRQIGLRNHHCQRAEATTLEKVYELAYFYDEPFADSSLIPTYLVCQQARKSVTVCLSGDGGDELFSGYHHHHLAAKLAWTGRIPNFLMQGLFGTLARLTTFSPRVSEWSRRFGFPADKRLLTIARLPANRLRQQLVGETYRERELDRCWIIDQFADDLKGLPPVTQAQLFDYYFYLPGDMLAKVDRASMANSLEVRVPFLSKRMAELTFRIPENQRTYEGQGKYLLRRLVEKYFGEKHAWRNKKGFSIPLLKWLKLGDLSSHQQKILQSEYVRQGLVDGTAVKLLFDQLRSTKTHPRLQARNAQSFFVLLVFDAWWYNSFQVQLHRPGVVNVPDGN